MFSLFKALPSASSTNSGELPTATPLVDLRDSAEGIVLTADLPGVAAGGLEVTVDGDRLTIRGRSTAAAPAGMQAVHSELQPRTFERSFIISETINREAITARIANGVAEITLPRRQVATPRRVAVQVN